MTAELLQRFKPQLLYDSQEAFFADSAAEMTDNPGNELRRAPAEDGAPGELIAAANETDPERHLSLSLLGAPTYTNGEAAEPSDRIGINGSNYRDQYARLRVAHSELKNRIYGHAQTDSDGRLWLQYWFWYFYNDYHLAADFGLHEGDWEMVQFRIHEGEPDLAVYAQHRNAEKRVWSGVKRLPENEDTPLVYPARGSHASYFEPGLYETEAWFDIADGKRRTPELQLEIVQDDDPPWIAWPGFWGDTQPELPGIEQPSPSGPARHGQWQDPKALLDGALTRPPKRPPPAPEVVVVLESGTLRVRYDFSTHAGPPPARLVVTVNSVDERGVPPRTFTFDVSGTQSGEVRPPLAVEPDRHYDVYTSVVGMEGGAGVPSASSLTQIEPAGRPRAFTETVLSSVKRVLWSISQLVQRLAPRGRR